MKDLEFGREVEFFARNSAKQVRDEVVNGNVTHRHELTIRGSRVVLWTDAKSAKPVRISLIREEGIETLEYLVYDDSVPFDRSMFEPPLGIQIVEPK